MAEIDLVQARELLAKTDIQIVEARLYVSAVKLTPITTYEEKEDGSPDYSKGRQRVGGTVEFQAAKHGTFGKASPSGSAQLLIQNEAAFDIFMRSFEKTVRETGKTPAFRVFFVLEEDGEAE